MKMMDAMISALMTIVVMQAHCRGIANRINRRKNIEEIMVELNAPEIRGKEDGVAAGEDIDLQNLRIL